MSYSPKFCPNINCDNNSLPGGRFIKKGHNYIKRIHQKVRKYQCKACHRGFSSRTFQANYRHKKMDLNPKLAQLLTEGVSLRASARILHLTYRNTYLKFLWFRKLVDAEKEKLKFSASRIQFDELETIHHTKCKPLNIVLVVNEKYQLLEAKVAEMPAKGKLAYFSRKKYGHRKNQSAQMLHLALSNVKAKLQNDLEIIESDANPTYNRRVSAIFPQTIYRQHNRAEKERSQNRVHEILQKQKFDPLFAVNHKCAILRSQIKRLTRRSWCTTKKVENLQLHLDLFILVQMGIIIK